MEDSESYRFELLEVSRIVIGDPDGAGSDTTTRSLTSGTIVAPDRWRLAQDLGEDMGFDEDSRYETIRIGDDLYSNDPFSMTSAGPTWVASPVGGMDEMTASDLADWYGGMTAEGSGWFGGLGGDVEMDEYEDEFTLDIVMSAYLLDMTTMQSTSMSRLVSEASDPAIEERLSDGGVRLRTTLAPVPELAEVVDEPIPSVEVLLDLNAADEPVLAQFTAEAGGASAKVEVRFSDWGAALRVDPPAEADVDRTPWIAEEAIAELDPALLVVPTVLPDSLELVSATVYGSEEKDGEPGCDSLELGFESEANMAVYAELDDFSDAEAAVEDFEELDYLYVSVTDPGCETMLMLGDEEFDEELGGLPARGDMGMWDVLVGDAVVTIDGTYDEEVLAALAASFAAMTPEEINAAIPDWAADSVMYGGMMGFGPGSVVGL